MTTDKTTKTAEELAVLNQFNNNYHFGTSDYFNKSSFDFQAETDRLKKTIQDDFNLLKDYEKEFLKRGKDLPIVGDALLLPTGETVYFCHVWQDNAQTCGGGSFNLSSSGFISFSGGLDSGIKINDIFLSEDRASLDIWFSHQGYLKAHSAIYASIKTRVWKCKEDANLKGIPQIARHFAKIEADKAEKITRVNGNGQEYILPCPIIKIYNPSAEHLEKIKKAIGIELTNIYQYSYYSVQLMTVKQYEKAKKIEGFDSVYHNGCFETNTLILTPKKLR